MSHALVFANGEIADGEMVQCALEQAVSPFVIAADGGARIAQHFDLKIDMVIGDMDSLSEDELQVLTESGTELKAYPAEKDFTDLELALVYLSEHGYKWIRIIGALGGRLDQMIGNVYLLALPALEDCDVRLVAGKQETRLLPPGKHKITGKPGDTISLIPLGGTVDDIQTENLYYPLKNETLHFGPARGISNVMDADTAYVTIGEGRLLLVHTVGRA